MTASPPSPGPEQAAPDVPAQNPMEADIPQQYLNNADIPAQYLNADIPAQYLNTANIPPQNPNTANIPAQYLPPEQTAVQTAKTADPKPGRLFVRVESMDCEACRRAVCLTEIFDGPTPVIFYDLSQKKYLSRPRGIDAESCVARELEALLGKNNVVWK